MSETGFDDDCVGGWQFGPFRLHHPVFPNRGNRRRSKRGRFCGDLAAHFPRFRSLPTITVSPVDFWPPVSASRNSVPGDLNFGRQLTSRQSELGLLRTELRAASEAIADSIRGFRIVGSIRLERRATVRLRCLSAAALRPPP
jgi:hypothetical protein